MKEYIEVEFLCGETLEECINKLIGYELKGMHAHGVFNGHDLYSDTVDMDKTYKEIVGMTLQEYKNKCEMTRKKLLQDEEDFKTNRAPALIKYYMEEGRKILSKDINIYEWDKIVPVRVNDIYHGNELKNSLTIIEMLNNGCTLEKAKEEIEKQGHSGTSICLVFSILEKFCDRGKEFVKYVNKER